MTYYDDNFGHGPFDPRDGAEWFRRHVELNSVEKECDGCGRWVKIMPQYDVCDSCATKREQGWAS